MYLDTQDTVVMSDVHANVAKLERVAEIYPGVRLIDAGDRFDGGNTSRYIQAAGELGVLSAIGNHEWVLAACLQEKDEQIRDLFISRWRPGPRYLPYEKDTLKSYGISEQQSNWQALEKLYKIMARSGHLDLLNISKVYYETDDFIVIHAGLISEDWDGQKKYLDRVQNRFDNFDYIHPPKQIMDEEFTLSTFSGDFHATKKTVITGHVHLKADEKQRKSPSGRHVRLASQLNKLDPLYVWQSWDGEVVAI